MHEAKTFFQTGVPAHNTERVLAIVARTTGIILSGCCENNKYVSSRKMRVLAHFTIHMVEFIQLYTDQPHTWLGFRHHPSSSVFQPYVWLGTISNSWNNTK